MPVPASLPGPEMDTEPEPDEPELDESEPEPPSGPMAEFDEAAVLAWLGTVPGLTAAQRSSVAQIMAQTGNFNAQDVHVGDCILRLPLS